MATVDDYFAGLDGPARAAFERVRGLVTEAVPEVEQGTSYGMPTLMYHGRPLLAFLATKHHLSVFPFSSRVVDAVRDQLPGFSLSSGTIRFTADMPLPEAVVHDIVRYRLGEIVAGRR
jgi:uncharacterized protein YdhG (YjbR/CyaY superfamily)